MNTVVMWAASKALREVDIPVPLADGGVVVLELQIEQEAGGGCRRESGLVLGTAII